MVVNSDLIEHIESTPDTIISLTNGQKLVVSETVDEVVERVIEFRRAILHGVTTGNSKKQTNELDCHD